MNSTAVEVGWREKIRRVIFDADTGPGKIFDVVLIAAIVLSVVAVALESVASIALRFGSELRTAEWIFTVLFTAEYALRILTVKRPRKYAFSFFGVIDFLAFAPTYFSVIFSGARVFLVIRILRLLRLFRIFKMVRYVREAEILRLALKSSQPKIVVFLVGVFSVTVVVGALMNLVEHSNPGFQNIPSGIYWAVVTLTTVGYGDIVPITAFGKFVATLLVTMGYGVIAVPTGIVSVELAKVLRDEMLNAACPSCGRHSRDTDANFCKYCGEELTLQNDEA